MDETQRRRVIEEELARVLASEPACPILTALHIGCAAFALGLEGCIEPAGMDVVGVDGAPIHG